MYGGVTREQLSDLDPEILFADGFDEALIGYTDSWSGNSREMRAVYSADRCLEVLMQRDDVDHEAALEFFEFNVTGAYVGPRTPVFVWVPLTF